jgi:hypothetical protein
MHRNSTTVAQLDFYPVAIGLIMAALRRLNVIRHQLLRTRLRLLEILPSPFEKLVGVNRMGLRHLRD